MYSIEVFFMKSFRYDKHLFVNVGLNLKTNSSTGMKATFVIDTIIFFLKLLNMKITCIRFFLLCVTTSRYLPNSCNWLHDTMHHHLPTTFRAKWPKLYRPQQSVHLRHGPYTLIYQRLIWNRNSLFKNKQMAFRPIFVLSQQASTYKIYVYKPLPKVSLFTSDLVFV